MKKVFFTLIAVIACSLTGFAQITLNDAYSSIVNHPGMVEAKVSDVQLDGTTSITNLRSVTCTGPAYASEFYYTYESLPVVNMLIGANNQNDMACAFTEPSANGVYNVLFLVGEKNGPYVAAYGQTSAEGLEIIRNCDVSMNSDSLQITLSPTVEAVDLMTMVFEQ